MATSRMMTRRSVLVIALTLFTIICHCDHHGVHASSSFPSTIPSSSSAPAAVIDTIPIIDIHRNDYTLQDVSSCPNNCSNHGTCMGTICRCDLHQLGPDCNTTVVASALGGGVTVSSMIVGSYVYVQFTCPAVGYCAIMLSPGSDGMTHGDAWVFTTLLEDRRGGNGQVTPDPASAETQDLINGTSWTDNGARVMAFARLLVTGDSHDTDISATDAIGVSYAYDDGTAFVQHSSSNRGLAVVNFALGTASPSGDASKKQILVPVGIALFTLIISAILINIGECRRSSLGHCCLRRKCCVRSCRHSDATTLDTLTMDGWFALQNLTWSELFVIVAYIISVIGFVVVAKRSYDDVARDFMLVSGQLAGWHLALTLLPITRTAPWITLMGIPFERAVKWHRWVARITILMATIHAGLMLRNKVTSDTEWTEQTTDGHGLIFGLLAWIIFVLMGITAYEPIRRLAFEVFYGTHYLFIVGLVFVCIHSTFTLYCCIIGMALWGIDRCVRFYRSRRRVTVKSARVLTGSETVAHLMLYLKDFKYKGGDFCFINVPSLSLFQWHPFSISSSDNGDGTFSFHIMAMNSGAKDEWTDQLVAIIPQIATGERSIYVDGPYGNLSVSLYEDYSHVVLCAGGIGITPMISILRELFVKYVSGHLRHVTAVHLIWCCSNETPLRTWFPKLLAQIQQHGAPFHLHLYATGAKKPNKNPDTWLQSAAMENGTYVNASASASAPGTPVVSVAPIASTDVVAVHVASSTSAAASMATNGEQKDQHSQSQVQVVKKVGTVSNGITNEGNELKVTTGNRPQFGTLFDNILATTSNDGNRVAVLTCGPHAMVQTVQTEAAARHFHLHKETFFL